MQVVQSELVETEVQATIPRDELPELPKGLVGVTLYFTDHGAWNGVYLGHKVPTKKNGPVVAAIIPDLTVQNAIALAAPSVGKFLEAKKRAELHAKIEARRAVEATPIDP